MRIIKEVPKWRKTKKWENAKNWVDKRVVFVEFEDYDGHIFKWMPTYKEIADIINALTEIEEESWS